MDSQTVEGATNDETHENKRVKMTTAECWKYFDKLDPVPGAPGADDVPRAKCKGCAKVFRAGDEVKKKLYNLFENYSSIPNSSTTTSTSIASSATSSTHNLTSNLFSALKEHNQQLATSIGKSQLDVYLEEPSLDSTCQIYDDLNVLKWWKENRSRLLSDNVEALICTRNWLHGFNSSAVVGDDEEKNDGSGRFQFQPMPTTSTEASYVYNIDDDDE
ncbi:hypothetical protein P8452_14107 [Trifolium repens]|nr:hypothetical protein P8452_14107 [Trifolium repens]